MGKALPLRILQVVTAMVRGGAETFIMNLYRHIDRKRFQFDFALLGDRSQHYEQEILSLGGRIFRFPHPREVGFRSWGRVFAQSLSEHGPFFAVHSHLLYLTGHILRVAHNTKIPLRLAHSHNTQDDQPASVQRRIYRQTMRWLMRRHATHLLGCSPAACEFIYSKDCWKDPRTLVIHNAINLDFWGNIAADKGELRKKIGLPAGVPVIGHVGRFDPQKNHRFIMEIFPALLEKMPSAHLVLVGDGPLRPEIEALAEKKSLRQNVHFLGIRADVPEILTALDLFLFPSLYEGLSVALVEVQAAGLPFIATDSVVADNDLNLKLGFPVSLAAKPETWADQMIKAFKAKRPSLEIRKLTLQAAGYDIHQVAHQMEAVYAG